MTVSKIADGAAEMFVSPPPCSKPLRILVTGGAGFIGSHLVDYLMLQGHEVLCVDSFYSGSKQNVAHWIGHHRFEAIRHDIIEKLTLEVDRIYHLACPASPVHYQSNAIKTLKTNVLGTLNVCGLARRTGARLLLASTSEVYGDPEIHPQREDYWGNVNSCGIRSCYDEGKRAAEALVMDYHRQHSVPVRIARIFNTYGPRMAFHDGRVVSNFLVQALRGDKISVYGDGSQTRSFCYVSDLVEGLVRLMEGDHVGPVNLGNPAEFTVMELAELVRKEINPSGAIEYRPLPQDDPRRRQPDITKAKELLGWTPVVSLEQGLSITAGNFKKRADKDKDALFCLHQKGCEADGKDNPVKAS